MLSTIKVMYPVRFTVSEKWIWTKLSDCVANGEIDEIDGETDDIYHAMKLLEDTGKITFIWGN